MFSSNNLTSKTSITKFVVTLIAAFLLCTVFTAVLVSGTTARAETSYADAAAEGDTTLVGYDYGDGRTAPDPVVYNQGDVYVLPDDFTPSVGGLYFYGWLDNLGNFHNAGEERTVDESFPEALGYTAVYQAAAYQVGSVKFANLNLAIASLNGQNGTVNVIGHDKAEHYIVSIVGDVKLLNASARYTYSIERKEFLFASDSRLSLTGKVGLYDASMDGGNGRCDLVLDSFNGYLVDIFSSNTYQDTLNVYVKGTNNLTNYGGACFSAYLYASVNFIGADTGRDNNKLNFNLPDDEWALEVDSDILLLKNLTVNSTDITAEYLSSQGYDTYGILSIYAYGDLKIDNAELNLDLGLGLETEGNLNIYNRSNVYTQGSILVHNTLNVYGESVLTVDDLGFVPYSSDDYMVNAEGCNIYGGASVTVASSRLYAMHIFYQLIISEGSLDFYLNACVAGLIADQLMLSDQSEVNMTLTEYCYNAMVNTSYLLMENSSLNLISLSENYTSGLEVFYAFYLINSSLTFDFISSRSVLGVSDADIHISDSTITADISGEGSAPDLFFSGGNSFSLTNSNVTVNSFSTVAILYIESDEGQIVNSNIKLTAHQSDFAFYWTNGQIINSSIDISLRFGLGALLSEDVTVIRCSINIDLGDPAAEGDYADVLFAFHLEDAYILSSDINIRSTSAGGIFYAQNTLKLSHSSLTFNGESRLFEDGADGDAGDAAVNVTSLIEANILIIEFSEITVYSASSVNFLTAELMAISFSQVDLERGDLQADCVFVESAAIYIIGSSLNLSSSMDAATNSCGIYTMHTEIYQSSVILNFIVGSGIEATESLIINNPHILSDLTDYGFDLEFTQAVALSLEYAAEAEAGSFTSLPESVLAVCSPYGILAELFAVYNSVVETESVITGITGGNILFYFSDVTINMNGEYESRCDGIQSDTLSVIGGYLTIASDANTDYAISCDFAAFMSAEVDISGSVTGINADLLIVDAPLFTGEADNADCFAYFDMYRPFSSTLSVRILDQYRAGYELLTERGVVGLPPSSLTVESSFTGLEAELIVVFGGVISTESDNYGIACTSIEMYGGFLSAEGGICDAVVLSDLVLHNGVKEWKFIQLTDYSDAIFPDAFALDNPAGSVNLAAFITVVFYFEKEAAAIPDSLISFAANSKNSFTLIDNGGLYYTAKANIALGGSQLVNFSYGAYSAYHIVSLSMSCIDLQYVGLDYPASVLVSGYVSQKDIALIIQLAKADCGISDEYVLPNAAKYAEYQAKLDELFSTALMPTINMEVEYATYSVGYVEGVGYSFTDNTIAVKHLLGEVSFKVLLDGYYTYTEGADALEIIGNYSTISYDAVTGIYTVGGVTSNLSLSVTGVYLPTVDISVNVVDSETDFSSIVQGLAVITGADSVVKGATAVLSITGIARGYDFRGWYDSDENLLSSSEVYSHTYTDDSVVYAVIIERSYITATLSGGNLEFVGVEGTVARIYPGKGLEVRAITPSGKRLTGIYSNGILKVDDSTSYFVYNDGSEVVITAQFEDVETGIAIGIIGGTIDGATASGVYEAGTVITVRPSPPDNYRFSFWALQSAPNTSIGDSEVLNYTVTASNAILVAKFIKINVATFNPGAGIGDSFTITVDEGNSKIFPDNLFASDSGFIGWTDGTNMYQPGDTLTLTKNTDFTAVWDSIYSISFKTDTAGVSGTTLTQSYINGTTVTLPSCMFIRKGYSFAGWLSGGVTYREGDEYTVVGNTDFIASWTILKHAITYPVPSALFTVTAANGSLPATVDHGGSVWFKVTPAAGYHISDIYQLINAVSDDGCSITYYENTDVYCISDIRADLSFSINQSFLAENTSSLTILKGAADAEYLDMNSLSYQLRVGERFDISTQLLSAIGLAVERDGYELVGFNINGTFYGKGSNYIATYDDVFAACVWKKLVNVTFTCLDDSVLDGSYDTIEVYEGDIIYLPENQFTAPGATFVGWVVSDGKTVYNLNNIGSLTVYEAGDPFEVGSKNVIFAAVFEPKTYSISFKNIDAINILSPSEVYYYGHNAYINFSLKGYYSIDDAFFSNFALPENVESFSFYPYYDYFGNIKSYSLILFNITGDVSVSFNVADIVTLTTGIYFIDNLPTSEGNMPDNVFDFLCGTQFTLPDLNKTADGLFFAGWQDWETGAIYSAGDKVVIEYRDYYFVALWGRPREISFSGGSGATGTSPAAQTTFEGRTVVLPVNPYSKDGFAFLCWTDGAQNYAEGASYIMGRDNVVITAVWQPTYAITFSSAIGSGTLPAMGRVIAGTRFTLPEAGLSSDNYKFLGWTDGSIFYVAGAQYTMGSSNVSFTALWVNVYHAAFSGGENASGTAPVLPAVVAGTTIILPANSFTKAGYMFMGWSDTEAMYPAGATYVINASDVAFTAVWERLTAVTFDGNNQTSGTAPVGKSVLAGTVITLPANTFVKDGYVFKGWEDGSALYQAGDSYTVGTVNVLLAASWERLTVVNFNTDHKRTKGETPDDRTATDGTVIILPENTYSRNNRTFVGWTDGTNVYAAGATYTISGDDVTLTPVWERNMTVAGQIFLILFLAALAGGGFCLYWFVLRVYKINFSFKMVKKPAMATAAAADAYANPGTEADINPGTDADTNPGTDADTNPSVDADINPSVDTEADGEEK